MKNKNRDGSLRQYIEYFVFRHVFLHEQVFMGKFVPSPLVYLPRTAKQTKMAAWWATISLFRFGFTRKSLDTVTKREDIQATQQLNSTKLKGTRRQEKSWISTRSRRWEKQTRSKIPNVMGAQLSLACTRWRKEHHEVQNLLFFSRNCWQF